MHSIGIQVYLDPFHWVEFNHQDSKKPTVLKKSSNHFQRLQNCSDFAAQRPVPSQDLPAQMKCSQLRPGTAAAPSDLRGKEATVSEPEVGRNISLWEVWIMPVMGIGLSKGWGRLQKLGYAETAETAVCLWSG